MKKFPLLLFALFAFALTSYVDVASAQPSYYRPQPGNTYGYTPSPQPGYNYPPVESQRNEWAACVYNQADRPRPIQVVWYGQRGVKERCTQTMTIQPGSSAVFSCQFRQSTPRTQLVAYGQRSGNVLINTWINSGVRDGRRECGRSNSSTIVGQGRNLQVVSGKPQYRPNYQPDYRGYPGYRGR